jgi:hypothetical protein
MPYNPIPASAIPEAIANTPPSPMRPSPAVSDPTPTASLADQEVAFWRGFIEWWARERDGAVPARAWDALLLAEEKRRARCPKPQAPSRIQ